jgi:hypothetical protein
MSLRGQQVVLFGVVPLDPIYALGMTGEPGARVWVSIFWTCVWVKAVNPRRKQNVGELVDDLYWCSAVRWINGA